MSRRKELWKGLVNALNELEFGDGLNEGVVMEQDCILGKDNTRIEWNGEHWELNYDEYPEPATPDNT